MYYSNPPTLWKWFSQQKSESAQVPCELVVGVDDGEAPEYSSLMRDSLTVFG